MKLLELFHEKKGFLFIVRDLTDKEIFAANLIHPNCFTYKIMSSHLYGEFFSFCQN